MKAQFGAAMTAVAAAITPVGATSVKADALRVPAGFNGSVAVARGHEVLLDRGYGVAAGKKIRRNDRFWVASVGKQFAAAAIMKLVEDRRLELDDPIGRILPGVPADKFGITIRQLLAHQSGFGQSYVSEMQPDRDSALRAMLAEALEGPPGEKFRYSNSNLQLAAAVIEVASGMSYANFVKTELWDRAGLTATGFAGSNGAKSVLPIEGGLPPRLRQSYWGEQGVYSSAPDLLRWSCALSRGKVLKLDSVETMFAPAARTGEGEAALGWFRGRTARGNDYVYIRGNEDFGANALIYAFPRSDIVIVVATHSGNASDASWSRAVLNSLETQLGL